MVGAAAAQVGFGDEATDPAAELGVEIIEFLAIGSEVDRLPAALKGAAFVLREADEADAGKLPGDHEGS